MPPWRVYKLLKEAAIQAVCVRMVGTQHAGLAVFGWEILSFLCTSGFLIGPTWILWPKFEPVMEGRESLRWPDIGHVSVPGRSSSLEEIRALTGKAWVTCPLWS